MKEARFSPTHTPYRHSRPVLQHVLGLPLKALAAQNRLAFQAKSLFYKHLYVSAIMNMTDLIHHSFDGMTLALVCIRGGNL